MSVTRRRVDQRVYSQAQIFQYPMNHTPSPFGDIYEQGTRPSSRSPTNKPLQPHSRPGPSSSPSSSSSPTTTSSRSRSIPNPNPTIIQIPTRRKSTATTTTTTTTTSKSSSSPPPPPVIVPLPPPSALAYDIFETDDSTDSDSSPPHYQSDDSSNSADYTDPNWQQLEWTSSGETSSEDQYAYGDEDDDSSSTSEESDDDAVEPWIPVDDFFPPLPPRIPRARRRTPLFPIATRSHKRASFKEAHKRRFGPLFPLDKETPEEKGILQRGGKMERYRDLLTCIPDRSIPALKLKHKPYKSSMRGKPRVEVEAVQPLEAASVVVVDATTLTMEEQVLEEPKCSCSVSSGSSSVTAIDSLFSSTSSTPTTAVTSCPSCSSSSNRRLSSSIPIPIPTIDITVTNARQRQRPRYPPPLPAIPVPACSCPLVSHILDTFVEENDAAAKLEAERLAAEEEAYQLSLVLAREAEERKAMVMASKSRSRSVSSSSPLAGAFGSGKFGWLSSVGEFSHFAYRENITRSSDIISFPRNTSTTSIPTSTPTQSPISLPSKASPHSSDDHKTSTITATRRFKPITTAYGYRASAAHVKALFPNSDSDSDSNEVTYSTIDVDGRKVKFKVKAAPVPLSSVEFESFDIPRSNRYTRRRHRSGIPVRQRHPNRQVQAQVQAQAQRQREESPLPRNWLDDPSVPAPGMGIIVDADVERQHNARSRSRGSSSIPSPPPSQSQSQSYENDGSDGQHPYRRRSVADQRFFRVYALENSIRERINGGGDGGLGVGIGLEWIGSRAIHMCRPVRTVCPSWKSRSPLALEGNCV